MSTEELTCPSCLSPLISEALQKGKCQCCGHEFDPEALTKSDDETTTEPASS